MRYLALDLGGSAIKHAIAGDDCVLSDKGSVPADFDSHAGFLDAVTGIAARSGALDGIAVSTCGELDPVSGEMFSGGTHRFNAGTNLIRAIQERCGVPVSLENDANCALIAEAHDGALADCRNGVVLVLGTGTGGAVMIDGRIHHGSHFHSGNVSFLRSDLTRPDSPTLAQLNGVPALIREFAALAGLPEPAASSELLFERLAAGDPAAATALGNYCSRLGAVIFNLQVVLDVEVVAIGGGISAQPALIERVVAEVDRQFEIARVPLPRPVVRACRYRNDANLIGALRHHLAVAAVPRP